MKKFIYIINALELLEQLAMGKRFEGVLYMDSNTGALTFKAYNRKNRMRPSERLICYLEHGRVMESPERIKVYESVPKRLGAAGVGHVLQREAKDATAALRDCELDEVIFC